MLRRMVPHQSNIQLSKQEICASTATDRTPTMCGPSHQFFDSSLRHWQPQDRVLPLLDRLWPREHTQSLSCSSWKMATCCRSLVARRRRRAARCHRPSSCRIVVPPVDVIALPVALLTLAVVVPPVAVVVPPVAVVVPPIVVLPLDVVVPRVSCHPSPRPVIRTVKSTIAMC